MKSETRPGKYSSEVLRRGRGRRHFPASAEEPERWKVRAPSGTRGDKQASPRRGLRSSCSRARRSSGEVLCPQEQTGRRSSTLPRGRSAQQPFPGASRAAEQLSTGEPAAFQRVHWNNQQVSCKFPPIQRSSDGECLSCLCAESPSRSAGAGDPRSAL